MLPLTAVTSTAAAAAMLDPTRLAILEGLKAPGSAASVAAQLGAPRQRIWYHIRELERAGLVAPVSERAHDGLIERRIAEHVQPPCIFRAAVDGVFAFAVQVHLEPGAMHDDAGGDERADLVGVRILLAQPIRFGQRELGGDVGTDVVAVVDGGGDELPTPVAEDLERGTFRLGHGLILTRVPSVDKKVADEQGL